uniref:Uncharacterized protein n=2 Tax=Oryza sativa subsp. japonica TaxID=39947 RepID=Q2QZ38_ORYSJ|nr:hypothetical protein [Oryza sativa Japonica Group]ABA95504.1 hypothetical protein LOC_Os11g47790 [Oryza sativa Japonica Group]
MARRGGRWTADAVAQGCGTPRWERQTTTGHSSCHNGAPSAADIVVEGDLEAGGGVGVDDGDELRHAEALRDHLMHRPPCRWYEDEEQSRGTTEDGARVVGVGLAEVVVDVVAVDVVVLLVTELVVAVRLQRRRHLARQ